MNKCSNQTHLKKTIKTMGEHPLEAKLLHKLRQELRRFNASTIKENIFDIRRVICDFGEVDVTVITPDVIQKSSPSMVPKGCPSELFGKSAIVRSAHIATIHNDHVFLSYPDFVTKSLKLYLKNECKD